MAEFFTESRDAKVVFEEARRILAGIFEDTDKSKSDELLKISLARYTELYRYTKNYFKHNRNGFWHIFSRDRIWSLFAVV